MYGTVLVVPRSPGGRIGVSGGVGKEATRDWVANGGALGAGTEKDLPCSTREHEISRNNHHSSIAESAESDRPSNGVIVIPLTVKGTPFSMKWYRRSETFGSTSFGSAPYFAGTLGLHTSPPPVACSFEIRYGKA
jgi:hypothetical protein